MGTTELESVKQSLRALSQEELQQVGQFIDDSLEFPGQASGGNESPDVPERRREHRFSLYIDGTASPLVAAPNGSERCFPITIIDVSRGGMKFLIDSGVPLYPLVRISFRGPTGRIRNVHVKLVRMRMIQQLGEEGPRHRCEVAARSISDPELTAAQQRYNRMLAANRVIKVRKNMAVLLVGEKQAEVPVCQEVLATRGHPTYTTTEMSRLLESINSHEARAVIFMDGSAVLSNRDLIKTICSKRPDLALLSVIKSTSERGNLLEAGIDECVHAINLEALLGTYLDRAFARKLSSDAGGGLRTPTYVLMSVEDNLSLAQTGTNCHSDTCKVTFSYDLDGTVGMLRCTQVDVLVMESRQASREDWSALKSVRREFPDLPVIVAAEDLATGTAAITNGATEYLSLPCSQQEMQLMISSARRVAEHELVHRLDGQQVA